MQTRDLEIKFAAGDAGQIEGYASLFGGAPDAAGDVIEPGAFAESLRSRKPLMLWAHDPAEPIGVWDTVREDGRGLFVKGRLVLESARGKEAYALLKAGALNGLSIGYRAIRSERKGNARALTQIELHEISIVAIPCHDGARIEAVKSQNGDSPMDNLTDMNLDGVKTDGETDLTGRVTALEADVANANERLAKIEGATDGAAKSLARIETKLNRPGVSAPVTAEPRAMERKAFAGFLRRGVERMGADEAKSLQVSADTAGGYLVPDDFRAELLKDLVEISPVRQAARVARTSRDSVTLPTRTGRLSAGWVSEVGARPQTEPSYGQIKIAAHEAACYVDVSNALLEDSAINVAAELRADFAEEFGRLESDAFINGDGVGKPHGFLDATAGAPVVTAALSADNLIDLYHGLPAFYRARGAWVLNAATIGAVRKMKDASGAYLWNEAISDGNPPTILGRPVIEAADMADPEPGETAVAFGDFNQAYRIIDRVDLAVLRDPYSVQTQGLVRFHARRRVGGALVKPEAVRVLTLA